MRLNEWLFGPRKSAEEYEEQLRMDYYALARENVRLADEVKRLNRFKPRPVRTTGKLGDADHPETYVFPPEVWLHESTIEDRVRDEVRAENRALIDELRARLKRLERLERILPDLQSLLRAIEK